VHPISLAGCARRPRISSPRPPNRSAEELLATMVGDFPQLLATHCRHPALDKITDKKNKKLPTKEMKHTRNKLFLQAMDLLREATTVFEVLGIAFAGIVVDVNAEPSSGRTGAVIGRHATCAVMHRFIREILKTGLLSETCKMIKGDHDALPLFPEMLGVVAKNSSKQKASQTEGEAKQKAENRGHTIIGRLELLRAITQGMYFKYGPVKGVLKPVGRDGNVIDHERCIIAYYLAGYQQSIAVVLYLKSGLAEEPSFDEHQNPVVAVVAQPSLMEANAHARMLPLRWNINHMEDAKKVKCPIFLRRHLYRIIGQNRNSDTVTQSMSYATERKKDKNRIVQSAGSAGIVLARAPGVDKTKARAEAGEEEEEEDSDGGGGGGGGGDGDGDGDDGDGDGDGDDSDGGGDDDENVNLDSATSADELG
jgi:hypothetical protein